MTKPPTVRWLDDREQAAWRGYLNMHSLLMAQLNRNMLAGSGMSESDYAVLVNLSEASGRRLRMCDLAVQLHLSPSGLTRRLDGLVRQGLVAREPSEHATSLPGSSSLSPSRHGRSSR